MTWLQRSYRPCKGGDWNIPPTPLQADCVCVLTNAGSSGQRTAWTRLSWRTPTDTTRSPSDGHAGARHGHGCNKLAPLQADCVCVLTNAGSSGQRTAWTRLSWRMPTDTTRSPSDGHAGARHGHGCNKLAPLQADCVCVLTNAGSSGQRTSWMRRSWRMPTSRAWEPMRPMTPLAVKLPRRRRQLHRKALQQLCRAWPWQAGWSLCPTPSVRPMSPCLAQTLSVHTDM